MSTFNELVTTRYSVRRFNSIPVEEDKVHSLLELARIAPTAHNLQPQRIKVLSTPEELEMVDECTPCRQGAQLVFLVCYEQGAAWERPFDGQHSGWVDASITTTYLMLGAQDLGLGSCWVMYFDPEKTTRLFELKEGVVPVVFLPVGYAAEGSVPGPRHTERVSIEELLL